MAETAAKTPTLTVWRDGVPIFTSYGKWLHPLFELEYDLVAHSITPEHLTLQDKIVGKAAALLIHRLGFRTVKAGLLSKLGEGVLQRHGIAYTYEQLVDRIHCQTEEPDFSELQFEREWARLSARYPMKAIHEKRLICKHEG